MYARYVTIEIPKIGVSIYYCALYVWNNKSFTVENLANILSCQKLKIINEVPPTYVVLKDLT
jgi:hypothetical protein